MQLSGKNGILIHSTDVEFSSIIFTRCYGEFDYTLVAIILIQRQQEDDSSQRQESVRVYNFVFSYPQIHDSLLEQPE